MEPNDSTHFEAFVAEAGKVSPQDREAFVRRKCGNNEKLIKAVLDRLNQTSQPVDQTSFLGSSTDNDPASASTGDQTWVEHTRSLSPDPAPPEENGSDSSFSATGDPTGKRVGNYRLIRKIADGGFGGVYFGRRDDDTFQKEVAVKFILNKGDSAEDQADLARRFHIERQILALLEHPNIARLLDAGTTSDGTPYLVMEYVEGLPIDRHCDSFQLDLQQRLRLFQKVCEAVHVAHQNLIIHRDIKPGNIFVTHEGIPKLLDFGIAKVLQPERFSDQRIHETHDGFKAMTLPYAATEQVRGQRITTATDVYALGVVLFELLTGKNPLQLGSKPTILDYLDAICDQEPHPPSVEVKLAEAGAKKDSKQFFRAGWSRMLKGDLDAIVLKALRKDPPQRYQSALAFAEDIQRYLEGQPVLAHKGSYTYLASKFIRRHQLLMLALVSVIVSLTLGFIGTTWQAFQARQQEARAETLLYAAHINLAQQAWNTGNTDYLTELLTRYKVQSGEKDRRGLEWGYLWGLSQTGQPVFQSLHRPERLAMSPDSQTCALALENGTIQLVDIATGKTKFDCLGLTEPAGVLIFSPTGNALAATNFRSQVVIWDTTTGEVTGQFQGVDIWNTGSLLFSPDGKYLFRGNDNGTITIWNMTAKTQTELKEAKRSPVVVLGIPTGTNQLVACHEDSIFWYDLETRKKVRSLKLNPFNTFNDCIALSPDGSRLTTSRDSSLINWDLQTGNHPWYISQSNFPRIWALAYTPDGSRIVIGTVDKVIKVYEAKTGKEEMTFKGHFFPAHSFFFSADADVVYSGSRDGTIRKWSLSRGKPQTILPDSMKMTGDLVFSPDGTRLAATCGSITYPLQPRLWDLTSRRLLVSPGVFGNSGMLAMTGSPDGKVLVMAVTPPGNLFQSPTATYQSVQYWDSTTGQQLTGKDTFSTVTALGYAPNGRFLGLGTQTGSVIVLDGPTRSEQFRLEIGARINSLAFSPDGARLLVASGDPSPASQPGAVTVWDLATRSKVLEFSKHAGGVLAVACSTDGKLAASAGQDTTIQVWDLQTGAVIQTLKGHSDWINSLAFGGDPRRLISASVREESIRIWDLESGQLLLPLKGKSVALSPDGAFLAIADDEGIRTFPVNVNTSLESVVSRQ